MGGKRGGAARGWSIALLLVTGTLGAGEAAAHVTATGLATVAIEGTAVAYRLTLVLSEVGEPAGRLLAAAADGEAASVERVVGALRQRVTIRADGVPCRPGRAVLQGSRLGDSRVTLQLDLRCEAEPTRLTIRDDWFDFLGEHYRTIVRIESRRGLREVALLPEAREATVELGKGGPRVSGSFVWLGIGHILTGWDHLLFLAALLLRGGGFRSVLVIVTAFTLAHSATLALAVLGLVAIPDRLVESVIAASIAWVALENVVAREAPSRRWLVSFGFGLVHGFGFASALTPLRLPPWNLAVALVGFNLGVEAGQAAAVAAALPLLAWMRRRPWEPRVVRALSLLLAALGAVWLVQRLFVV
ncbi:MAG: HupE/UreJ family protein [Candidatus Rokubacteria bacterium]|nr:HupE/UreJ family protein [Candidatus Rokubacteria bacterium]